MKIGVVFCSYGMPEYLSATLDPWIRAREDRIGGSEFVIAAVSMPFVEYKGFQPADNSTKISLSLSFVNRQIDQLFLAEEGDENLLQEHQVRDKALQYLIGENCDLIWLVDGDEFYDIYQIQDILNYVILDKFTSWFRLSLRNYVFDTRHYLKDNFTPPRIFRVKTNGYVVNRFRFDNDIVYRGTVVNNNHFTDVEADYTQLPSKTVPEKISLIKHYSWLSNERTKRKIFYQNAHFHGLCSFKWNEEKNTLEFNEDYFRKTNQMQPEVVEESAIL